MARARRAFALTNGQTDLDEGRGAGRCVSGLGERPLARGVAVWAVVLLGAGF